MLFRSGYRPNATLDQHALATKTRPRDRDDPSRQVQLALLPGFIPNHAGMVRKAEKARNPELSRDARLSPLSTAVLF